MRAHKLTSLNKSFFSQKLYNRSLMDQKKCQRALKALKKHLEKPAQEEKPLFEPTAGDAEPIYLVVQSKRYFAEKRASKPKVISLPHSVWADHKPSICIFTRDPQRKYKDALEGVVDRVIGVSKLKGKFKPYEARRLLRSSYELFICEDDVYPMLPKLLGKIFYKSPSGVPVPIRMKDKEAPTEVSRDRAGKSIDRLLNSTVAILPASTLMHIRIGSTALSPKELAENAKAVEAWLVDTLKEDTLRSLSVRSSQTPALPIWYTESLYSEADVGAYDDPNFESEAQKRVREEQELDSLLAEVVPEDEIAEYNRETKKRRKDHKKSSQPVSG